MEPSFSTLHIESPLKRGDGPRMLSLYVSISFTVVLLTFEAVSHPYALSVSASGAVAIRLMKSAELVQKFQLPKAAQLCDSAGEMLAFEARSIFQLIQVDPEEQVCLHNLTIIKVCRSRLWLKRGSLIEP